MSEDYIKGSCTHCNGRISFPAGAKGSTIKCPHCAQATVLSDPNEASGGDDTVKGSCTHCNGRISFPAYAAGASIACPHCSQSTVLTLPAGAAPTAPAAVPGPQGGAPRTQPGGRLHSNAAPPVPKARVPRPETLALAAKGGKKAMSVLVGGGGALLVVVLIAVVMNFAGKGGGQAAGPVGRGEGLEVLTFNIQKAQEGGLVYVVGTLTNHDAVQYFDVRVEFNLFDASGAQFSDTSDYQGNLAPNDGWEFRALVLEEGVAKAELKGVTGEPDTAP